MPVVIPFLSMDLADLEPIPTLTPRQCEILALNASGMRVPQIADQCYVSRRTVEFHLNEAIERLGAKTRTHAIVLAIAFELLILTHDGRVVVPHPHRIAA
jgi:DNA-binding NarL/FixJ family response regulator